MKAALRIALLYVLLSGVYIGVSDIAVHAVFKHDPDLLTSWQSMKGLCFIIASAVIIFGLVLHYVRIQERIQHELDEARHSFEQLFDRTPIPLLVYELESLQFVGVNQAAIDEYGYSREEFLGMKATQLHPPGELERFLTHLARIKDRPYTGRSRHQRKDGTHVDVEIIAHRMEHRGRPARLVVSTNVTSRTVIEQAMADTFSARAEAEQIKSRFLSTISHEMRTPLNAIAGFLDLLATETDAHQRGEFLAHARTGADELVSLVDRLIKTASLASRPPTTRREDVRLREYLERITMGFESAARQKKLTLKFSPDPTLPQIARIDAWWLEETLQILLGNAVKFSHSGTILLRADMEAHVDGETSLRLALKDEGIGISPDQHKRIFESFTQANEGTAREFGGIGMGLFIARQLCDLMGATIAVQSSEEDGSTFTITLSGRLDDKGRFVAQGETE